MNERIDIPRYIVWQKWRDPFGGDEDEAEWPGAFGDFTTDEILKKHTEVTYEEVEEEEVEHHRRQKGQKLGMVVTPMGLIPMTEHTRATKLFNFWTAHTTFRMNNRTKKVIDYAPGVESLDVFSPYRWRICIGKVFDSTWTKNNLMTALDASYPPDTVGK